MQPFKPEKMKKLIFSGLGFIAVVLTFFVISCEKDADSSSNPTTKTAKGAAPSSYLSFERLNKNLGYAQTVTITCPGCSPDKCGLTGSADDGGMYTDCNYGCGRCSMVVTEERFSYSTGQKETITLSDTRYQIHFWGAFQQYKAEFFPGAPTVIDEIEITADPEHDTYTILYTFTVNNAKKSVRFSKSLSDGTTRIDCTGTCDCRERYFPSTGASECTCSPCHMDVTNVEKSLY